MLKYEEINKYTGNCVLEVAIDKEYRVGDGGGQGLHGKGIVAEAHRCAWVYVAGAILNKYRTVTNGSPSLFVKRYFTRGESDILLS